MSDSEGVVEISVEWTTSNLRTRLSPLTNVDIRIYLYLYLSILMSIVVEPVLLDTHLDVEKKNRAFDMDMLS